MAAVGEDFDSGTVVVVVGEVVDAVAAVVGFDAAENESVAVDSVDDGIHYGNVVAVGTVVAVVVVDAAAAAGAVVVVVGCVAALVPGSSEKAD